MKRTLDRESLRLEALVRLTVGKTQEERNRLGQFATPPLLAASILQEALMLLPQNLPIRFLEPGFGTGAFYSALTRFVPDDRIETAVGYEIDPLFKDESDRLWCGTRLSLALADFTMANPTKTEAERFNFVACNPPYVRHHHLKQAQKRFLQARTAELIDFPMNGLGGLYTYFMVLSKAWMTPNGVGVWLIPSEFMDVNYGKKVKQFLLEQVTLHRIHRYDSKEMQFDEALVPSAVVIFRNSPPPSNHTVRCSYAGSLAQPHRSGDITVQELRQVSKWTRLPQTKNPIITKSGSTLSDVFTIKRGIATGSNSFFILTAEKVEKIGIPKEFLIPILPSPRLLVHDEVLADEKGEPCNNPKLFLLDCKLSEEEICNKYPKLWGYLTEGEKQGVHQGYICGHRLPWYSQEIRPSTPFLCTYMGRPTKKSKIPFRFILNFSKATAPNVYLMLYPKPALALALKGDPDRHRAVWRALSSIDQEQLVGEGRLYGGGLYKMEPRELANVPADSVLESASIVLERQQTLFPDD